VAYTLLVADDSVTIQRVIELTFADEDVRVVAVSDGDQAIARLESAPPDIVLADIGMPGKNGYEVARYIKQSPKLAHIPVVLLTGAFEPVDQARAAEVGCDGVLAKPFEPQLVIGRVRELLAAPQPQAANAGPTATAGEVQVSHSEPDAARVEPPARADSGTAELDDYFDRLDVAFAKLSANPAAAADDGPELPGFETAERSDNTAVEFEWEEEAREHSETSVADQIDRYASLAASPAPAIEAPKRAPEAAPTSEPAPAAAQMAAPMPAPTPAPAFTSAPMPVSTLTPVPSTATAPGPGRTPSAAPQAPPSLADAFAAILAAEQGEVAPDTRPTWPLFQLRPPEPAAIEVTDDLIRQVSQRVLEQMSDRVVKETVAGIVTDVAERLIREEIERIKASLR
jgi:CheY-like chemotaxis protein